MSRRKRGTEISETFCVNPFSSERTPPLQKKIYLNSCFSVEFSLS